MPPLDHHKSGKKVLLISQEAQEPADLQSMLSEWLCGNQHAIDLLNRFFFIAATWDDLIDQDTLVLEADIHACIEAALTLTLNPFYVQHISMLQPILLNSIRNWKAANLIERDPASNEHALLNAFILRASYVDLLGFSAALIKDQAWAVQVTREARLYVSREGFSNYLTSLTREKELRHGGMRRNG